ncbi:MAG: hypothetical protein Q4G33_11420 [bacterium]|nr:hypothetical protein [bacterium]MDO5398524.1 hypothetical protein [bacterium]
MLNYEMERIDADTVVMTTERGEKVTLHFQPEDNPDIENIITDNLLTSYERRIKAMASNG